MPVGGLVDFDKGFQIPIDLIIAAVLFASTLFADLRLLQEWAATEGNLHRALGSYVLTKVSKHGQRRQVTRFAK